jgi:site-specific DNA-methyltransferase (adenine-specific)/adenine-specific DNA-methyltransferase
MNKLKDNEIEKIVNLLNQGKSLPEDYKRILFDTKKEYELIYADKEREEDILADTMAVPLQRVKTFRNGKNGNGWTNMLIFGDNLQVLKTLLQMKQEGKLKNADGTPGVRLIYIDPPFATRQEFRGSQDQKAYQDKIAGARFLEFLRKRLVFLHELLSEDGSIYVHLDYKKGHYVKSLMDEIFNEPNFRNEIIVKRGQKNVQAQFETMDSLASGHDTLLFYSKESNTRFPILKASLGEIKPGTWNNHWRGTDRPTMRYELFGIMPNKGQWRWSKERTMKAIENYEQYLKRYSKKMSIDEYYMHVLETTGEEFDFVRLSSTKKPEHYVPPTEHRILSDVWMDLVAYEARADYPTQKSEELLNRIVCGFSNPGDLVLDCFTGSGTTQAVAEKSGRRWIGVDCGKLAIYTIQKRLLNITESKDLENPKKKYGKPPKPFTLYNAGLYDYKMIKELPWEQYRDFALKLFQCRDSKHEISKIELDGYLGADSVMVFNYQKHPNAILDRGFIDDLHNHLGGKIGRRFFIIAPAASVRFLEDYIEKGKTKYFILRIPYSIIEEIHNRGFSKIKQPVSEMDVNDTVDAVGFDFIQVPIVECKYFVDNKKGQLELGKSSKECVIKIEKFESKVISRKPFEFANLETLSMVMLDYDFDGEVFDLDEVFYAEELKKNGYEVRFAEDKVKGQIMVIYIDLFGNEKREVKTLGDFNGKRKK